MRAVVMLVCWLLTVASGYGAEGTPNVMALDDLIVDKATLRGKTVTIQGFVSCIGSNSYCMLYDDVASFTKNVMFLSADLPRADRAKLNECNLLSGCRVTLRARVVDRPMETIAVIAVDWGGGMGQPDLNDPPPAHGPDRVLSVRDFELDKRQLEGQLVTVGGSAWCDDGSDCVLAERGWTAQLASRFDASALPRDIRKKLLACMNGLSPGCPAEVSGKVVRNGIIEAAALHFD